MSFVKINIHAVWGTKNREPVLTKEIRVQLFEHIRKNAVTKNIFIDTINGHTDHVHCLFSLPVSESISKVMQLIKGESSFWMNKNRIVHGKFEWADEYFAVSVSESQIEKVRTYILNQEEHHKKITFAKEYESFMNRYNFVGG